MNSAFVGYEELGRSWRVLSTSADNRHNTLLDLPNSSFPTQPHSLIPNYNPLINFRAILFVFRHVVPHRRAGISGALQRSTMG